MKTEIEVPRIAYLKFNFTRVELALETSGLDSHYVGLTIKGDYALFKDAKRFESFISQLLAARDLIVETGRKIGVLS